MQAKTTRAYISYTAEYKLQAVVFSEQFSNVKASVKFKVDRKSIILQLNPQLPAVPTTIEDEDILMLLMMKLWKWNTPESAVNDLLSSSDDEY
jgi:hypothetical protein